MTVLRPRPRLSVLLASAALFLGQPALAQDPAPIAASGDKHIYVPADFARFAPRTAADVLYQIPGFKIQQASQDRGIGQASENILLNGQRVANKSGGAIAELAKMTASQVDRIEIVDAASLNIAGLSGQVANVILKAQTKGSGQFEWDPSFANHFSDPVYSSGNISYSDKQGRVNYTVALDNGNARTSGSGGSTTVFDGAGQPQEYRQERSEYRQDSPKASARLTMDGPIAASANVSYQYIISHSNGISDRDPLTGPPTSLVSSSRSHGSNIEAGGDVAFGVVGGKLKLIGLLTRSDSPYTFIASTLMQDAPQTGGMITSDNRNSETVGRAEYGLKWGSADVQLSAEAAFNSLDGSSSLFTLDPTGAYVETPYPGADLRVAEERYEWVASYDRHIARTLTLQLVGGSELSTLTAGPLSRTFLRYKGSASLGWKADARTDVSLKLGRVVEQLNFYDFLASISLIDNSRRAGNIGLVPPQSWTLDLETTHRLGPWGSTRVRVYGQRTEDIVETIPIEDHQQAQGNVDHAQRYGVEWQNSLILDPMGWKGARIEAGLSLEHSSVRDPLTGLPRPISYNMLHSFSLSVRQDIPGGQWAWGAYMNSYAFTPGYQLTEIDQGGSGTLFAGAFIEKKNLLGMKVRASANNLANAHNRGNRTVFDGWRTDPVLFREVSDRQNGRSFNLSFSGNF